MKAAEMESLITMAMAARISLVAGLSRLTSERPRLA